MSVNRRLISITVLWFFLLVLPSCTTVEYVSCSYQPVVSVVQPRPELTRFEKCGVVSDGEIILSSELLKNIDFKNSRAAVYTDKGVYYVNTSGKAVRMFLFDNGPDYFVEGLARTVKNNKTGFVDKKLKQVIAPRFDFAFPFRNGRALVCNQCYPVKDGEHSFIEGGQWGYIDKTGKIIVPVKYTSDEIKKMLL